MSGFFKYRMRPSRRGNIVEKRSPIYVPDCGIEASLRSMVEFLIASDRT